LSPETEAEFLQKITRLFKPDRSTNGRQIIWRTVLAVLLLLVLLFQNVQADNIGNTQPVPSATPETITSTPILKLTFPEAASHPVSGWRPSLFPIPYALGPHDHFYLNRPIAVTTVNWPLADYRYGYKDSETDAPHTGVDIDAQLGTPILAAGDGKVVFTGYGLALGGANPADPYGLAVMIRHNFAFDGRYIMTVYAHMEEIDVKVGQKVKTGDKLGLVGLTGNTSGPHVHFEVRLQTNDAYSVQNPELWMVPPTDDGILVGRLVDNYGDYLTNLKVTVKSQSTGKTWTVYTYATQTVKHDSYYAENLVLSDLPIGEYSISFRKNYKDYTYTVNISSGAISYFHFMTSKGFSLDDPTTDDDSFLIPYNN
jgi:murein DD-endopeptidase MepM/ murein hydrolase activator NlpD